MPTNRPFFANFLAAFRAHSALTASKPSTSPPSVTTATPTSQFTLPSNSAARTITTSHSPSQPSTQPQQPSSSPPNPTQLKSSTASPPTTSATATAAFSAAAAAAGPLSHRAHHASTSPPPRSPTNAPFTRVPQRRGSDSSSEGGFREVLGGEKWYIGGRTATGEERFYRMGIVKREKSWDKRSFDQLSL
ncbi:MAG: hypothetical protein Q9223_007836 [Gallowayella weberi]